MSVFTRYIGNVLRELRTDIGVTQDEAAKQGGLARTQISKWEGGKVMPEQAKLKKLCAFYNIDVDQVYYLAATAMKGKDPEPAADPPEPAEIDEALLTKVLEGIEQGLDELELELEAGKKAQLAILLYKHFSAVESDVEPETVRDYLKLVA